MFCTWKDFLVDVDVSTVQSPGVSIFEITKLAVMSFLSTKLEVIFKNCFFLVEAKLLRDIFAFFSSHLPRKLNVEGYLTPETEKPKTGAVYLFVRLLLSFTFLSIRNSFLGNFLVFVKVDFVP